MTIILLAGALLFMRSLRNMQTQSLGMDTQNIVTSRFTLGQQRYAEPAQSWPSSNSWRKNYANCLVSHPWR